MKQMWVWSVVVASVILLGSGCESLDKYQALERSHRLLGEKLTETEEDLKNAQLQNQQKDTQIAALKSERDTLAQTVASLQAENESLRKNLDAANQILEKMAGKQTTGTIMINSPLPPAVDSALKRLAEQFPGLIEYLPDKAAVRWKADLLFPLGSDQLTTSADMMQALKKFVDIVNMAEAAKLDVIVVGHTCNTPIRKSETLQRFKDNWYLSAGRAIVVMQLFRSEGVGFERMGVMGYGEYRPIADNSSSEGKAKNRRVEVYLVPRDSVQSVGTGRAAIYETRDRDIKFAKVGGEPTVGNAEVARGTVPVTRAPERTTRRMAPGTVTPKPAKTGTPKSGLP